MPAKLYTIGSQSRTLKQWREILGELPKDKIIYDRVWKGMSFIEAITYVRPQTVYIGEQYGQLEVIGNPYTSKKGTNRYCKVKCSCGIIKEVRTNNLKRGVTKSCGCLHREVIKQVNKTHGLSYHPLYSTWKAMNDRCNKPTADSYSNYGGKGVYVCDEWHIDNPEGLTNFIRDMYPTWKEGYQLDKDIKATPGETKCYSKSTCVWVTPAENVRAASITKLTVDQVKEIKRRSALGHSQPDIAKDFKVSQQTISAIATAKNWSNI